MSLTASLVSGLRPKDSGTAQKGQQTQSWYRALLSEAFRLSWRRKSLWFFGFFAALLSSGSEVWSLAELFSRVTQIGAFSFEWGDAIVNGSERMKNLFGTSLATIVSDPVMVVGGALFVVMSIIVVIAIVCQGSLISALVGKTERSDRIDKQWGSGRGLFWRVAAINLITKLGSSVAILAIGLPLLSSAQSSGVTWVEIVLSVLAFLLFVPIVLVFSLAAKFMLVHIASHPSEPLHQSFHEALRLLRSRWLVVLEFVIIMFFVSLLALLVVRVLAALLMLPFLVGIAISYSFGIPIGVTIFYVGWILSTLALIFVATAYLSTVEYAAWVLLYKRIASEPVLAKLERVTRVIISWTKHHSLVS